MEHRTKPPMNAESADNPFGFILSYAANITETKGFYQVHTPSPRVTRIRVMRFPLAR